MFLRDNPVYFVKISDILIWAGMFSSCVWLTIIWSNGLS